MKKIFVLAIVCLNLFAAIQAKAQAPTGEEIKAQFIKDWERAKTYTVDYLNTMPANKYSFKAQDSIRSFAQQMLHLAQANVGLLMGALGEPLSFARANLEGSPTAQTKDSVMYYVTASYDYAINGLKKLNPATFGEKSKFFNFEETKYVWFLKAFEHQTHHRGQTTVYIRLQGIKPPQERLF
jgi:uncharacterized damage-inducible protein DinB